MNNTHNWKKTFAIIWSGQFFSTLSSSIVGFAVVFWLSTETGSAEVLAYAMIAVLLPFIILGLFTGVYVDRWDRKRTMILADSFVALCSAALGILFYLDITPLWLIYILLALRSAGSAFHVPAMQASVPLLAPESELMRIAGINQMIQSISNIAGPALGAILISLLDMTYVMMLDVLGAIIACTSLLFVVIPNPEKKEDVEPDVWLEIKEGIRHLFMNKGITYLMLAVIGITFFIVPISALYPLMTTSYFGGNAYQMGLVETAWGIGMLVGGAFLSLKFMKTANKVLSMNIVAIGLGITYWIMGVLPTSGFVLFVLLTAISGIAGSVYWSSFTVILQTKIDPAALGRVFSIYDSVSLLPTIPGLLATGLIAERIGLLNAFIIAGVATLIIGIIALFVPAIQELGRSTKGSKE
ncbi:DHA3 family macrolide efflux protein-like MFS transporter [Dysgonomonas sp. PFB1-18]|uniref:MFS transporter n=1 Tax=unclassified Dysgonomonas TaxID=2630389 RepID=UPI0024765DCF|nr:MULTISPECIES: MFS transporter [unclassified Dysgonomonas]MDH6307295.1 DHA3 family macrolide efflux protein-like MFS transporter [Dysgonomonas sp. PF1-14]MDH6337213.1 DHA3 family macrolide efflux protein-like MFS transporter [Dysgonomonas sp. PF1-16]MDH6379137.1 DHA3 family macrolide efflux protein-like MFS transporter [Dysgonomonas sp. PFB1-18]MDH6396225.1 DHA3 family macrolide efflux protein-like MFS transporter [Dysgonomonas sp. PF1-23]